MQGLNNKYNGAFTITNEELSDLPLKAFQGEVVLIHDKELLSSVLKEIMKQDVVGFDTETRPSFRKGQIHKVALMQIAIPGKVFLIRLQHTGITQDILGFLENEAVIKTGVGIRDDIMAIQKLKRFQSRGFVDLALLAKDAGIQVESVKKLAGLLLGFRISKSAQTSNWEAENLTQKQIEYAATDAWVCLELYGKLQPVQ